MKPMTEAVFEHLKRHGSIRTRTALREYGCERLAARIGEIREAGHPVETVLRTVESRGRKARVAEYRYPARRSDT